MPWRLTFFATLCCLLLSACQTLQDIRYVQASEAAESGNDSEAFQKYLIVAQQDGYSGQTSAQYIVGDMYLEGKGTSQNPSEALKYFELVANSSDRTWKRLALGKLGLLYEEGIEGALTPDRVKAARYYKIASSQGNKTAATALKRLSSFPDVFIDQHPEEFQPQGSAIAPAGLVAATRAFANGDRETAVQTFLWHARRGNEEAQTLIAKLYKDGIVLPQDTSRYAAWSLLAARNGNPRAQLEMGILNSNSDAFLGSDREAEYWFGLAADQGMIEATNWLGIVAAHPLDKNAKSNWPKAVSLFSKAAEGGSVFALVNLGDAYAEGLGVPLDTAKARDLYRRAAALGSVEARRKLAEDEIASSKAASIPQDMKIIDFVRPVQDREPTPSIPSSKTPPATPISPAIQPSEQKIASKPGPVEIYSGLAPSVFRLFAIQLKGSGDASQGSAVVVTPKIAITNCHVLEGFTTFGTKYAEEIILFKLTRRNNKKDICIVEGNKPMRAISRTRRYADIKIGEKVYAIGSPQSLENTLSEGIISGLREMDGVRYIQTTAPIAQGSSGGGLFDEEGRLIGITTFIVKGGGNLNFAVAIDEALEELDQIK